MGRGGYQQESRAYRSRGRSGRGQGHGGGWFGDSEGHSEAGRHSHDNY
jgi:hypothetical protein